MNMLRQGTQMDCSLHGGTAGVTVLGRDQDEKSFHVILHDPGFEHVNQRRI